MMMTCGHAANARMRVGNKYVKCCAICDCSTEDNDPKDLEGRVARCGMCGKEAKSDPDMLAFFEYCGDDSRESTICKNCGCTEPPHLMCVSCKGTGKDNRFEDSKCRRCKGTGDTDNRCENGFEPKGDQGFDRYYCGCRGWD